jgi:hypothetical protein
VGELAGHPVPYQSVFTVHSTDSLACVEYKFVVLRFSFTVNVELKVINYTINIDAGQLKDILAL